MAFMDFRVRLEHVQRQIKFARQTEAAVGALAEGWSENVIGAGYASLKMINSSDRVGSMLRELEAELDHFRYLAKIEEGRLGIEVAAVRA